MYFAICHALTLQDCPYEMYSVLSKMRSLLLNQKFPKTATGVMKS